MTKRLSDLYGMDIYSKKGEHVGKVQDVILNLETKEVMRLCLQSFKAKTLPDEKVKEILQNKSVGYNEVIRIEDIILCEENPKKLGQKGKTKESEEE